MESDYSAPCWLCFSAVSANYTIHDFILVGVALLVLPAFSIVSGRTLARGEPSQASLLRRYTAMLIRDIAISVYILLLWRFTGRSFASLGLSAPSDLRSEVGFALDIILVAVLAFQFRRLGQASPQQLAKMQDGIKSNRIAPRNSAELPLFLILAVVGSAWEELFFRGFLFWFFVPVAGLVGAVLASAILFGVAHAYQGWRNILRTALIGTIFALAYVMTRNLWWLIVAHLVMNVGGAFFGLKSARLSTRLRESLA